MVQLCGQRAGQDNKLISPHPLFVALGDVPDSRPAAYRDLFALPHEESVVENIRRATNGNFLLGDGRFADEIAAVLGRRVQPGKAGRPRRVIIVDS